MKTYTVTVDDYGSIRWYNEVKQIHRDDGPAIEYDEGYKEWRRNGKLHRENGPAIEFANGDKYWYLNGKRVTEADVMRLNETIDIEGTKYTLAQIKAALKKK